MCRRISRRQRSLALLVLLSVMVVSLLLAVPHALAADPGGESGDGGGGLVGDPPPDKDPPGTLPQEGDPDDPYLPTPDQIEVWARFVELVSLAL